MVLQLLYNFFNSKPKMPASAATKAKVSNYISSSKVFVASKSYCPYCASTKKLLNGLGAKDVVVLELDNLEDGGEIQDALLEITGQRTVPNVFIGGKHIGGNSDVQALSSRDQLVPALQAAGSL